jgi:hypothetical protein
MSRLDLETLDADWLTIVVSREEVELGDASSTLATLRQLIATRNTALRFQGSVDLAFHGYDADPRELYEIPEVCRFCMRLDEGFPFWFFFLSTQRDVLKILTFCLCQTTKMGPGLVMPSPQSLGEFIEKHFGAMNLIFDKLGLADSLNEKITQAVLQYYGAA